MTKNLSNRSMDLASYATVHFSVRIPSDHTKEDVLSDRYFQGYYSKLKEGCVITVISDDYSVDMDLRVTKVTPVEIAVKILRDSSEGEHLSVKVGDVSVGWGGPHHRFRLILDGEVLQHGFETKDQAISAAKALEAA